MRQLLCIALATALAFAAGVGTGRWVERHRPVPPPPASLGSEFFGHRPPLLGGAHHANPPDRAELLRQVEALRPQIEAFRSKMERIDADFSREFDLLLNPEQRTRHDESLKRMHDLQSRRAEGKPASDDRLLYTLTEQSTRTILWDVIVPLRLDWLARTYKLDETQREKVQALLIARRQKVIELIDSSPPPSVMLSRLAPWMQRMAHPDGSQLAKP
jgi:hypothetical protein